MIRRLLLPSAALLLGAAGDEHGHHHHEAPAEDAQLVVTINPEARVSVVRGKPLPPPAACGAAVPLSVRVVNHGFVTAPLRAELLGDDTRHVALHMAAQRLSGGREEKRILHLVPSRPDPADVTIAFSLSNDIGDLGGRDRVHLLISCRAPGSTVQ